MKFFHPLFESVIVGINILDMVNASAIAAENSIFRQSGRVLPTPASGLCSCHVHGFACRVCVVNDSDGVIFAERGKEGLIRLDDPLKVIGFNGRRQSQEPVAPAETGIFVDPALLGARSHDRSLWYHLAQAMPDLLFLASTKLRYFFQPLPKSRPFMAMFPQS